MKIAIMYWQHETNTFNNQMTTLSDFTIVKELSVLEMVDVSSFIAAGVELVPILYANALPSGILSEECYYYFERIIINKLSNDIDGLWLHLHGAMEVDRIGSGEKALLHSIRNKIGYDIPIAVVLDFHANNTEQFISDVNIVCGYRTAPHIDQKLQERKSEKILIKCIRENLLIRTVFKRVPIISNGDIATTSNEPTKSIMDNLDLYERESSIYSVSYFNGQPWADVEGAGASVVISCTNTKLGYIYANEIARQLWNARHKYSFIAPIISPMESISMAMEANVSPVFITDTGDNVTGGAPGSSTLFLKLVISNSIKDVLVAGIVDKSIVERCTSLPDQSFFNYYFDSNESCNIKILSHGKVIKWNSDNSGKVIPENLSNAIVVDISGVTVIFTQDRCAFTDPQIIVDLHIDYKRYKIIIVKLGYLFPKLADISKKTIMAMTEGATCEDITKCIFRKITHPMYPIDGDFDW